LALPEPVRRWANDPLVHFVVENAKGILTSFIVYALFRLGEWGVESFNKRFPLASPEASEFLAAVFSWGGALVASALWAVISVKQLREFWRAPSR
jgi:hypothetical protein